MSPLRVHLFGGLTLIWNRQPLPPMSGSVARSLIAFLVIYRERAPTRDLLAGTFWPDLPDAVARRRLSQTLWQIRRNLDPHPALLTEGDTVRLNPELPLWLDVEEFSRLFSRCTGQESEALAACASCVDLYRGEFLAGYYDDWLIPERERLREMLVAALGHLVEGYKRQLDYDRALVYARRLATEDPWRGGGCPLYSAPAVNYVNVELGPYDDLTVGGAIFDQDYGEYQRIFNGRRTIEAGEITPGRYTVRDQQIELTFLLDVIVGPEAGELPDLTISDVTAHEASGQLRIHVFNNAADLVDRDIVVGLERISSNELLDSITWQRVTIPSGGERILQSADLTMAPSDLRVTVDWDDSIDEMNEENNSFETPVLMRVEFVELWSVTPCESWLNCDFEHWFMVMAGHGTSSDDVQWVGEARYPESGNVYQYRVCHWGEHGIERGSHWNLTGQPNYTFEFEMPADHNLYIRAYGYEEDVFDDDYQGYIFEVYSPHRNHGHSADLYEAASTGYEECDDGGTPIMPGGWDNLGFSAKWRITKLQ